MTELDPTAIGAIGLLIPAVVLLLVVLYLVPVPLWIAAWSSGAYVRLMTLVGMRLRRVPPATIVNARISAVKAGLQISIDDLEAHHLAGGNVVRVVNALISADKANIEMPRERTHDANVVMGGHSLSKVTMARKRVPTDRENARSIARWEGEGGARKSPSAEERDSRDAQVTAERRRTRQMRRRAAK